MAIDTWAKLIEYPEAYLRALVEVDAGKHLPAGSDWTSEGSSTYSHDCDEVALTDVTDDGQSMTERATIALVKSNAGSWYFDFNAQKLYVHCFDNDDLSSGSTTTTVVYSCWKRYSTDPIVFSSISPDYQFAPVVSRDSLPLLDISVDDIVDGIYKFNFGSFSMNNDGWFDKASEEYIWTNRRVVLRLGGESLPYSEYQIFFLGRVSDFYVSDEEVIFVVKDIRVGTFSQLPIDHYWKSTYPNLSDIDEGKAIPIFYGVKTNIVPTCIDPVVGVGGKWKIAGSRTIKDITDVRKNGISLAGAAYTEDLTNAEFTLNISFNEANGDYLEVDAEGYVDGGSALITNASDIAKDILQTYLGFTDSELNLSSFTNVKNKRTQELCMYLDADQSSRELLHLVGRSVLGYFVPTEDGKLSFEIYQSAVPAGILELFDRDYSSDWEVRKDHRFLKNKIRISYDLDPKNQAYKQVEKNNYSVLYKYGVRETLNLETFLKIEAEAENLAEAIRDMCSEPLNIAEVTISSKGYILFPTRKIKVTRERAPSITGSWSDKTFRLRAVGKDTSVEGTRLSMMDDDQTLSSICHVCYICQSCFSCQVTYSCVTCDACETCVSGCQDCEVCDDCDACEGTCENCQQCVSCDSCDVACYDCNTCQSCVQCETCDECDSCQSNFSCVKCNSCQTCVSGCQKCVSCEGTCEFCELCDSPEVP